MVYLDSGFFVAYTNRDDKYHLHARDLLGKFLNGLLTGGTTNDHVLSEVVSFLLRRTGKPELAYKVASEITNPRYWKMERITEQTLGTCIRRLNDRGSLQLTLVDWTVVESATEHGHRQIVTCDNALARYVNHVTEGKVQPVELMDNDTFLATRSASIRKGR